MTQDDLLKMALEQPADFLELLALVFFGDNNDDTTTRTDDHDTHRS